MAKKMTGIVAQFGTKGYGFISGDDGEKYFVHQKNVFNKSRLRSDTRVKFKVESSEKGLVAVDVKLEKIVEDQGQQIHTVILKLKKQHGNGISLKLEKKMLEGITLLML